MTSSYVAVVKYATTATRKEQIAALRDGLTDIAVELVEQFDLPLDAVEDALDNARSAAEDSAEYAAQWKADNSQVRGDT